MLKRLKIWQKFLLIAIAFVIPTGLMVFRLFEAYDESITFNKAELDGTQFLRPIHKLISDVSAHRDLLGAVLAGDASFKPDVDKKAAEVEEDIKAVDALHSRFAPEFGNYDDPNQENWAKIKDAWQALKATPAGTKPELAFEQHAKLIKALGKFTHWVGNASNLILDPSVDTHYPMDGIIFKIPKLTDEVSAARAIGMIMLASGGQGEANLDRKYALAAAEVKISDALEQLNDFIRFVNKSTGEVLRGPLVENVRAVKAMKTLLEEKVLNASTPLPPREYLTATAATLDVQEKLWNAEIEELDRLLTGRIAEMTAKRLKNMGIVGLAILIAIILMLLVMRSITKPVAHLSQIADRISLGEMDAQIQIDSKDEIGELGERFRRLQVSLKAAMEQLDKHDDSLG